MAMLMKSDTLGALATRLIRFGVLTTVFAVSGCGLTDDSAPNIGIGGSALPTDITGQVAAKAIAVADQIGGVSGFGGMLMSGYSGHMMEHMGFHSPADLAAADGTIAIRFNNETDDACTFHLAYVASHLGLDEHELDVIVPANSEQVVELPCLEIIGLGELEHPGVFGCHLADGEALDNIMALPGFLGTDFTCGGSFQFHLMHDANDLDGDGDTAEPIVISEAMQDHMLEGGPLGHRHHDNGGIVMMGGHMGG